MRIIFMGTPEFAVPSLDILVKNNYNVVAVITSMDSYGGRGGKQLIQSAVKKYALEHDIPILQPKNLKAPSFIEELASYKADIQIVVAFRMLPQVVWNMPPLGTFNLHGSLLPKYRGAAPINHAVIQGESITGVTSFKLKHEIDTGDVVLQEEMAIDEKDNAGTVHDKMMILGADVVLRTVQLAESRDITFKPQNHEEATPAPKIFHENCEIDFNLPAVKIYNFIRGLSPYPGAWCTIDDKEMKILDSTYALITDDVAVGKIVYDNKKSFKIRCSDGYIYPKMVKQAGKKLMSTPDFLNGYTIESDQVKTL